MTHSKCSFGVAAAVVVSALLCFGAEVRADVPISDFSNFALTGTYVNWDTMATFTSGAADFRVESTSDFGGGFHVLAASVDGSGNDSLELELDVNPANVADFNIVLIDGDGTERVYRYDSLVVGAGQTITKDLSDFLQDNAPGTVAGLDISDITVFHLQGTFANGNPGLAQDLTFDNLALVTTIPEPASMALMGLAGLAIATMRRRK